MHTATRLGFAFIAMLAFSGTCAAQDTLLKVGGWEIVVPDKSRVTLAAQPDEELDAIASFDGRFVLSGEFVYGWAEGVDEEEYGWLALGFKPDAQSLARLPHFKGEAADFLQFTNEDDFVAAAIPRRMLDLLKRKKMKSVSGRIAIVVDHFTVAKVPCDSTGYLIHFIAVDHPAVAQLSRAKGGESTGCG